MAKSDKRRRPLDWVSIKADYLAVGMSLRELARKHGCSHSTIANFANRNGWVRPSVNSAHGNAGPLTEGSRLSASLLVDLGRRSSAATRCTACAALVCPGWESMPGGFDAGSLQCIGTLREKDDAEPTLEEHLPQGVHGWSPEAPIDPSYFPYNRCSVWACTACGRPFLRYTEYGGYYVDERVRELNADRVRT